MKGSFNIVFCLACVISVSNAQEIRTGIEWEQKFLRNFETDVKFQLRDDLENKNNIINQGLIQMSLAYKPVKYFSVGGSVRYSRNTQAVVESFNTYTDEKFRYTADIVLRTPRFENDIRFSNRIRYQYSVLNDREKSMLRNKLKMDYKLTKRSIPYLAVEPYFSVEEEGLDALRLYVGSDFEIVKNRFEIYMIVEVKEKRDAYYSTQIFGFNYKF